MSEFDELARNLGGIKTATTLNQGQLEKERTGSNQIFSLSDSGAIHVSYLEYENSF